MLESLRLRYGEWTLDGDPPATAERDAAMIRAYCAPADPKLLAVELKRTVDLFPAPNDMSQAAALSEALMEALEDAPLDIAQAALKRVRMECKWFPKPAEVRERVMAEMGERKRAALKAEVAASMAARRRACQPSPEITDEDRRRVSELVASIGARPSNPMHGGPERVQVDEAKVLRKVADEAKAFRLPDENDPAVQRWLRPA